MTLYRAGPTPMHARRSSLTFLISSRQSRHIARLLVWVGACYQGWQDGGPLKILTTEIASNLDMKVGSGEAIFLLQLLEP